MIYRKPSVFLSLFLLFQLSAWCQKARTANNSVGKSTEKSVNITVHFKDAKLTDTFRLVYYEQHLFDPLFSPKTTLVSSNTGEGYYNFVIKDVKHPLYFNLFKDIYKWPLDILRLYLCEPGDSINIRLEMNPEETNIPAGYVHNYFTRSSYKVIFSGKGAEKYKCRQEAEEAIIGDHNNTNVLNADGRFLSNTHFDASHLLSKKALLKYRPKIRKQTYDLLTVDIFSMVELERLYNLLAFNRSLLKDTSIARRVFKLYQSYISKKTSKFEEYGKTNSYWFPKLASESLLIDQLEGNSRLNKNNDITSVINFIKKKYAGEMRDKVLVFMAYRLATLLFGQDYQALNDASKIVNTNYCIEELNKFMDNNSVGNLAYNFSLPDINGKYVKLEDFIGKVVFIDYWYSGCTGCAQYYESAVSSVEDTFKNNKKVVFITINIDTDRARWKESIKKGIYTSDHVINLNTDGAGSDHPVIKNYRISSYPKPLLVGKDGKIFSLSFDELRGGGANKLIETINKALMVN